MLLTSETKLTKINLTDPNGKVLCGQCCGLIILKLWGLSPGCIRKDIRLKTMSQIYGVSLFAAATPDAGSR